MASGPAALEDENIFGGVIEVSTRLQVFSEQTRINRTQSQVISYPSALPAFIPRPSRFSVAG